MPADELRRLRRGRGRDPEAAGPGTSGRGPVTAVAGSSPFWTATVLRTMTAPFRSPVGVAAMKLSSKDQKTRSGPRTAELAPSDPSQRGSWRNRVSALARGRAEKQVAEFPVPRLSAVAGAAPSAELTAASSHGGARRGLREAGRHRSGLLRSRRETDSFIVRIFAEDEMHRRFGMQQRGVENRQVAVCGRDEQAKFRAAENHGVGAGRFSGIDDLPDA